MADESTPTVIHTGSESSAGKWILLILALAFAGATIYFLIDMHGQLDRLGKAQDANQQATQQKIDDLDRRLQASEAEDETLAKQVGMTKKDLEEKASELQRAQKASETRLAQEQKKQIGEVSGQVESVKTDVGGVKTDVASTKAELAAAEAKLQSTIGDLGQQSGLIAHTRDDLEILKHKGDRNYYEFTLLRGAKPQPVGTISLQLKKADEKHGKFTLTVISDEKSIEKKDKNIAEPIQFYSGRDHNLFEIVVWTVDKKKATGYLSTPKSAPVPITASN